MPGSTVAEPLVAPAYFWVPPHTTTAGGEVADLARQSGMPIDAEQQLVLDALFAERADGSPVALESCVICARQNLKTHVLRAAALADLVLFSRPLNFWTSHRDFAVGEAFREFEGLFTDWDHLRRRVKRVVKEDTNEAIELLSGARLLFKLRTPGAGRSLSGDTITLDEGFALNASMIGDLYPTLATKPHAQVRIGSSAGKVTSEVLRSLRDRGRGGGDMRLTYVEYGDVEPPSCELPDCDHRVGRPSCSLDDVRRWERANPALYRRIPLEMMQSFRNSMPVEEFAREELSWWDDPPTEKQDVHFPTAMWPALADESSKLAGTPMFVLDVAPDGLHSVLAAAGARPDGLRHVEVLRYEPDTAWVGRDLRDICRRAGVTKLLLDVRGPAGALVAEVERMGLEVEPVTVVQMAQACGALAGLVRQRALRHLGQWEVDEALAAAATKDTGDGAWLWVRKTSTGDISPLIAVTVAAWAAGGRTTSPPSFHDWSSIEELARVGVDDDDG